MNKRYFITGIGTGVGKSLVSAILAEAWNADYWKPVQAGTDATDSDAIQSLISNPFTKIHPERYCLKLPASPHQAAKEEGIRIGRSDFEVPRTKNTLLIEGAGGLMVPINDTSVMADLAKDFEATVILVVRHYLGSINHSLLSAQFLKSNGISAAGIIFCGEANDASADAVLSHSGLPCIGTIPLLDAVTKEAVLEQAAKFKNMQP